MAFTQSNLDAVEVAIASGELSVSYEGKMVTYRSMDDLIKARDTIKAALATAQATPSVRVSLVSSSKGT